MAKPQLTIDNQAGFHNTSSGTRDRIIKGNTYKDQSTICVVPTRGVIPAKVVQSWMNLFNPMNQKFMRIFITGMEVGEAYSQAIDQILAHPDLSKWKYVLSLEEDNMVPPDGLIKLIESIEGGVDGKKYDGMSGLYWTKGEGGQPMVYGNPAIFPKNFIPFMPAPDTVTECNGLGMGFCLLRLSMLKDQKIERPLFKTVQQYKEGQGTAMFTQDLYFYQNAGRQGYKFAVDSRVKVGHFDLENDVIW